MSVETLTALETRLLGLETIGTKIAREAAPGVLAAAKATAAAGTDPYGKPWAPRLDGGRALANAASAISVAPRLDLVVLTLSGVEVQHQFKTSKNLPVARKILPDVKAGDPVPSSYVAAIHAAATRVIGASQ